MGVCGREKGQGAGVGSGDQGQAGGARRLDQADTDVCRLVEWETDLDVDVHTIDRCLVPLGFATRCISTRQKTEGTIHGLCRLDSRSQ